MSLATFFESPRNLSVAREFSWRGMATISFSSDELKARRGIWIHSSVMDRELPNCSVRDATFTSDRVVERDAMSDGEKGEL